jgi:hypothetical protein
MRKRLESRWWGFVPTALGIRHRLGFSGPLCCVTVLYWLLGDNFYGALKCLWLVAKELDFRWNMEMKIQVFSRYIVDTYEVKEVRGCFASQYLLQCWLEFDDLIDSK